MTKILIDPGHGGSDPGAVGNGLQEKDLTLKIAKKIQALLKEYKNVSVKLSRTGDTYPTLTQRAADANKWGADFFLSIHINAGGGTGYEDYRYSQVSASSNTGKIQNTIHDAIMKSIKGYGITTRGKKAANYAVLRQTNMPALLTESLFIDRAGDAKLLKNDAFLDDIAQGHVDGLVKAFKLEKVEKEKQASNTSKAPAVDTYTIKKGDTLWSIAQKEKVTVAHLKKWNPDVEEKALQVGNKLQLEEKEEETYKVKKGDTFWGIEEKLNLKHGTLAKLNPKVNAQALKVGQTIKVQ